MIWYGSWVIRPSGKKAWIPSGWAPGWRAGWGQGCGGRRGQASPVDQGCEHSWLVNLIFFSKIINNQESFCIIHASSGWEPSTLTHPLRRSGGNSTWYSLPVLIEGVQAGQHNSQVVCPGGQVWGLHFHSDADVRVQALQGGGQHHALSRGFGLPSALRNLLLGARWHQQQRLRPCQTCARVVHESSPMEGRRESSHLTSGEAKNPPTWVEYMFF